MSSWRLSFRTPGYLVQRDPRYVNVPGSFALHSEAHVTVLDTSFLLSWETRRMSRHI